MRNDGDIIMNNTRRLTREIWMQCLLKTSLKDHLSASFELNGVSTFFGSVKVFTKSFFSALASFEPPLIAENTSHLVVANGFTEVEKICGARITSRSGAEVAIGHRYGLTRSSFSGQAGIWDVIGIIFFVPVILCLGALTFQLSRRSAIWRFPTSLTEAQNILRISEAKRLSVLLGNLDHVNSAWILRSLSTESMGIASPPFLHINCCNLRIPNIVLRERWQEEEIKLSKSICISQEIYFWENAVATLKSIASSADFSKRGKKIFVLSSGYWLRRDMNHGDASRISHLASLEHQIMKIVRLGERDVEFLAHPREFKFPERMRLFYPLNVLPTRSLDDIEFEEYIGASFVGCQSTAFNSCLRLKDQGLVNEVLMVVPKSWKEWSLNDLSIGKSIITIDNLSGRLDEIYS